MKKISVILIVLGLFSLSIAVFQFVDHRAMNGMVSLIFMLAFWGGAWYNRGKK